MRKTQGYLFDELSIGTCYYPEHWDKALWESDLDRMQSVGIKTIRIAEFAWNLVEAEDGVFDFGFFDEFLDLCESKGMKVIFGTPTATPPVWLTEKYPEVLNASKEGVLYRHGLRRHYNYNSSVYQRYCQRIVTKIAEHYGQRACIIGWQIDNELNCERNEFYSKADTAAFRIWLKLKYKDIKVLNKCWGTVVWNQTYNSFEQIYVPRPTVQGNTNPHQMLDYYRFISDSTIRFCKIQSDILRKYIKKGDFITTNGMFANVDNHKMTDLCLDIYTYDSYPNFAFGMDANPLNPNNLNDRNWSRNLSEVRNICPNFGIMEQQSGANGWDTRMEGPAPKPGQIMLWAMQSIAHGADFVSFFRWRTACIGTEIYWHGILDYDNKDNRKLREIQSINDRINKIKELVNSKYKAYVAIVRDYDNNYDNQLDSWHRRLMWDSEMAIFNACQKSHTPMDYAYITSSSEVAELKQYDVLFYPHPVMTNKKIVDILSEYVKGGGILVLGARSGMKDSNGHCPMSSMPGLWSELTRTVVKDFTFVGPADGVVNMNWDAVKYDSGVFNDVLEITGEGCSVLATYDSNYYEGEPCLVESRCGNGKVLHFGGTFTESNARAFLEYTETESPFLGIIRAGEDVEIAVREKDGYKYIFVLNYSNKEQTVLIKKDLVDLDTQKIAEEMVLLEPFGTKIYRY